MVRVVDDRTGLPLSVQVDVASLPVTGRSLFLSEFTDDAGIAVIESPIGAYRLSVNRPPQGRRVDYDDHEGNVEIFGSRRKI